jgi:hypothetical protein
MDLKIISGKPAVVRSWLILGYSQLQDTNSLSVDYQKSFSSLPVFRCLKRSTVSGVQHQIRIRKRKRDFWMCVCGRGRGAAVKLSLSDLTFILVTFVILIIHKAA